MHRIADQVYLLCLKKKHGSLRELTVDLFTATTVRDMIEA